MNQELPDVQADFKEAEEPEIKSPTIHWLMEKARKFQKNIYVCFIDYTRVFDCVDHNKLWKILKEIEIPNHLPCLLRNLFAGQEATVRTRITERNNRLVQNWERSTSRLYIVNPAYLTYMQSISCKMLSWMKLKLNLRLSGGVSAMSDVQMIPL